MGYRIEQIGGIFSIRREHHEEAIEALRALWGRPELMRGGDSWGNRWFSFCNVAQPDKWTTLPQALGEMRWETEVDEAGNIVGIQFVGERLGEDDFILEAIAPYVENESFIRMEGEDGERWHWTFNKGRLCEIYED